jgi:glycerol-3-phosphate dehydrogenase
MSEYDVAVIGAGVCGANIAHRLSAYRLKVAILEKEADVSFGTSKANSGIIHGGFHHPSATLKAKLELRGALMFDRLRRELDFPYKRCGILVAALHEDEMRTIEHLYAQGTENGVIGLEMCSRERMLELEPKLHADVVGGMYAPTGGIVEPYRFVFALIESALRNGVELKTGFSLAKARRSGGWWELESASGQTARARYAVNAAGLYADEVSALFGAEAFRIQGRKGEYYLLDRLTKSRPERVVFPVPSSVSKGMLVIPTVERTVLIGPTADAAISKEDLSTDQASLDAILDSARRLVPSISANDAISSFAGLRPVMGQWLDAPELAPLHDDFYIAASRKAEGLVQVAGIQSPGLTASPAIGEYVKDLLKKAGLELTERADHDPCVPARRRLREASIEEADALVASDPAFGNVVCRCERVSEAEIVEAVRLGHKTLDGVKYFTRAQMGRCQGGFCEYKIIKIIMRETGMAWDEVTKRGPGSRILEGEL